MKFTTKDFITILVTAVLTAVIIIGYDNYFEKKDSPGQIPNGPIDINSNSPMSKSKKPGGKSIQVDWKDLVDRTAEYRTFNQTNNFLKVQFDESGTKKEDYLNGFVFTADQLRELLDKNKHTIDGKSKVDQVVFYLGKNGDFTDPATSKKFPNIHLFAIGMTINNKGIYMLNTSRTYPKNATDKAVDESIFDQADPTPPYGPNAP